MGEKVQMAHPWISPTTVTGALTCTTLDSRISTSLVFSHISRINASCKSCFSRSWSIHASRLNGAIKRLRVPGKGEWVFEAVWLKLPIHWDLGQGHSNVLE